MDHEGCGIGERRGGRKNVARGPISILTHSSRSRGEVMERERERESQSPTTPLLYHVSLSSVAISLSLSLSFPLSPLHERDIIGVAKDHIPYLYLSVMRTDRLVVLVN
jgi:hypothetical protein